MWIKTTVSYHCTWIRVASIRNYDTKCWWGCGEIIYSFTAAQNIKQHHHCVTQQYYTSELSQVHAWSWQNLCINVYRNFIHSISRMKTEEWKRNDGQWKSKNKQQNKANRKQKQMKINTVWFHLYNILEITILRTYGTD
jgi:hypothetical protein